MENLVRKDTRFSANGDLTGDMIRVMETPNHLRLCQDVAYTFKITLLTRPMKPLHTVTCTLAWDACCSLAASCPMVHVSRAMENDLSP